MAPHGTIRTPPRLCGFCRIRRFRLAISRCTLNTLACQLHDLYPSSLLTPTNRCVTLNTVMFHGIALSWFPTTRWRFLWNAIALEYAFLKDYEMHSNDTISWIKAWGGSLFALAITLFFAFSLQYLFSLVTRYTAIPLLVPGLTIAVLYPLLTFLSLKQLLSIMIW